VTALLFERLLAEEHQKLLEAGDRDVHDDSKRTTLPIAREIVEAYVAEPEKPPWYIDLLNLNLGNHDLPEARRRVARYLSDLRSSGRRATENLDFAAQQQLVPEETR
jgi:malate synthase